MFENSDATLDDVLQDAVSWLGQPLRGPAQALLDDVLEPDSHSGFVLGRIVALQERVRELYDDMEYLANPTEEIWAFGSLLHLRLIDDERPAFALVRQRVAELLLNCLASWEGKDEWERDVELLLREQLEEEAAFTAA